MTGKPIADAHRGSYEGYFSLVRSGLQEPMSTLSVHFSTNRAYGTSAYSMGAVYLHQIRYIIGEDNFYKGIQRYFNTWKMRHPEFSGEDKAQLASGIAYLAGLARVDSPDKSTVSRFITFLQELNQRPTQPPYVAHRSQWPERQKLQGRERYLLHRWLLLPEKEAGWVTALPVWLVVSGESDGVWWFCLAGGQRQYLSALRENRDCHRPGTTG